MNSFSYIPYLSPARVKLEILSLKSHFNMPVHGSRHEHTFCFSDVLQLRT